MKTANRISLTLLFTIGTAATVWAAESSQQSADAPDEVAVDDEIVTTGEQVHTERAKEILDAYTANAKGGSLYRKKQYDEALPHLLFAAKHGFKDAQARLGNIYEKGHGSTARDMAKAVGWLGVAAHKPARTEHINYWKNFVEPLSAQQMTQVNQVVAVYVKNYGPEATGMECLEDFGAGSHIKRLSCRFKEEEMLRDVGLLAEDLAGLDPYNTIPGIGNSGAGFGGGGGGGASGGAGGGGGGGGGRGGGN